MEIKADSLIITNVKGLNILGIAVLAADNEQVGAEDIIAEQGSTTTTIDLKSIQWYEKIEADTNYKIQVVPRSISGRLGSVETVGVKFNEKFVEGVNYRFLSPEEKAKWDKEHMVEQLDSKVNSLLAEMRGKKGAKRAQHTTEGSQGSTKVKHRTEQEEDDEEAVIPPIKRVQKNPNVASERQPWYKLRGMSPGMRTAIQSLLVVLLIVIITFAALQVQGCRRVVKSTIDTAKEQVAKTSAPKDSSVSPVPIVQPDQQVPTTNSPPIAIADTAKTDLNTGLRVGEVETSKMFTTSKKKTVSRKATAEPSPKKMEREIPLSISGSNNHNIIITGDVAGDIYIENELPPRIGGSNFFSHRFSESRSGRGIGGLSTLRSDIPDVNATYTQYVASSVDVVALPNDLLYPGESLRIIKDVNVRVTITSDEMRKIQTFLNGKEVKSPKDIKDSGEVLIRIRPGASITPVRVTFAVIDR